MGDTNNADRVADLVLDACPPAWRDAVAADIAVLVNLPAAVIVSRFRGAPPWTIVERVQRDHRAALEAACRQRGLACTWRVVATSEEQFESWRPVGIAVAVLAASMAFIVLTPTTLPRGKSIGAVAAAEVPVPIHPPVEPGSIGAALATIAEHLRSERNIPADIFPGAEACVASFGPPYRSATCDRVADSCATARAWLDEIQRVLPADVSITYGRLLEPTTGLDIWSVTRPMVPVPVGLCLARVTLKLERP
jgi:hypothetical protein